MMRLALLLALRHAPVAASGTRVRVGPWFGRARTRQDDFAQDKLFDAVLKLLSLL